MTSLVDRLLGRTESAAAIAWRTMAGDIAATGPLLYGLALVAGLGAALAFYVILPA